MYNNNMENRPWEVSRESAPVIKGTTIQDYLYMEGMYNPVLRFAFTNILDTEFHSAWNSKPYVIPAHASVKLPHYLAAKFTKEIVDIMMNHENKGLLMAVPANRKPYEDKVLSLLPDEDSLEMQIIKNDFIEEVKRDSSRIEGEADAQSPAESVNLDFEDLRNRITVSSSSPDKPKVGRPKKIV